ncbi:hypothetical protein BJI67_15555 [Acidihalobacter aeolianus]|uniref:Uncharacterized protein n=1 Tax=Acidihalobacter aeolianus TaxID=2792603 RepID=A0A1D8KBF3_9GAMM|nr:DUF1207 domain-containing protein [Acidihalobacter aeolianus]AOV18289.1 hypothetical protein BJI67_15555 [Acidihalobacter aeolianus]
MQIDFAAGAFSQFNLDVASPELVNTDFTVGIPITWRRGANSLRVELMHQSSHLGPRYFANQHPSDYSLSFEKLSSLWSHRCGQWQYYGGGGYLLWPVPTTLKRLFVQSGLEYRGPRVFDGFARFVAGFDVQSWAESSWKPDASLKLGLAYAGPDPAKRMLRVMLDCC